MFSQAMPVDTVYNQSYDWRPGQRETLPEWVFASQRKGRVVGISDPCMKSEAARMLALQRAAYLYSLQQGVQLRLLSDVFPPWRLPVIHTKTKETKCLYWE